MTHYLQKEVSYGVEVARWVVDAVLQHVIPQDFTRGSGQLIHILHHHPEVIDFDRLMHYAERQIGKYKGKGLEDLLDKYLPAHGNIVHVMETATEFENDEKFELVCTAEVYRWASMLFLGCCRRDTDAFDTLDDLRAMLNDPGGAHIQVIIGTLTSCLFYAGRIVSELVDPPEWVQAISESLPCSKTAPDTRVEDRVLH